jgi:predicted NBD/HSP70 family sugar kinase
MPVGAPSPDDPFCHDREGRAQATAVLAIVGYNLVRAVTNAAAMPCSPASLEKTSALGLQPAAGRHPAALENMFTRSKA